MPLRRADTSQTKRFEDGSEWLELRTRLTKRDEDLISDLNSHYRLPAGLFGVAAAEDADPGVEVRGNVSQTNRTLFELLSVGWSLGDGKPTATEYDALDPESGRWVDTCIVEALKIGRGRAEGNATSSERQNGSPDSSDSEAPSRSTRSRRKSAA